MISLPGGPGGPGGPGIPLPLDKLSSLSSIELILFSSPLINSLNISFIFLVNGSTPPSLDIQHWFTVHDPLQIILLLYEELTHKSESNVSQVSTLTSGTS